MSENKRYYWLKLDEKFFEGDTIQWLEEQKNGKDYVIFYLKLMLKSLQNDGSLIRYVGEKLIPYDITALAKLTGTNEDTVAVAMKTFVDIGLVDLKDSGEIYMSQIEEMVGSETHYAVQKRKQRAVEGSQKRLGGQCPDNVKKCPPEIELEKDIEKDKNTSSSASLTEDFEKLWNFYPNKQGKKKAFTAYQRAMKNGATNKQVQDGIIKYKKHLAANDWLKPAHGSTWFANERWNDEYDTKAERTGKSYIDVADFRKEVYGSD